MYEIEKGVSLENAPRKTDLKYPFREMEIGDSIFVACDDSKSRVAMSRLVSAAYRFKPKKFATRTVEGGIRCWRTA